MSTDDKLEEAFLRHISEMSEIEQLHLLRIEQDEDLFLLGKCALVHGMFEIGAVIGREMKRREAEQKVSP